MVGIRQDEKFALLGVEWVYDMDMESDKGFIELEEPQNELYTIETVLTSVC